ncbi:MAG: hypothetical protein JNM41_06285 [Flavipsychrobacter sp.]|nr:hypothetical protein [Flavipsychrobacter sp.]
MSYDLYFYKRKNSQLTEQQIGNYLDENLQFNISDVEKQWNYENPETGVYFLIDWNEEDPEFGKDYDNFPEHKYLNFSFSVNFFRPRFFAFEIFPIIEKFIHDLDLSVLNLQDETNSEELKRYENGYLQDQWIRHNDGVTLTHFDELKMDYMPLEKSNYIWLFQSNRRILQDNLQEDIFVPGFFVLKSRSDEKLYTACVWPQHIPVILPPVDYLIVQKKYKKLFRTFEESGLVSYHEIIEQFGNLFSQFKSTVPDLKVLKPIDANKIEKQFNALKLGDNIENFGQLVGMDSFVNVKP